MAESLARLLSDQIDEHNQNDGPEVPEEYRKGLRDALDGVATAALARGELTREEWDTLQDKLRAMI